MFQFLKKLYKGNFGLSTTFWMYGVVLNILTVFVYAIFAITIDSTTTFESLIFVSTLFFMFYGTHLAYQVFIAIAIWNAACKYDFDLWRILAQLIVIIYFCVIAARIITAGFLFFQ